MRYRCFASDALLSPGLCKDAGLGGDLLLAAGARALSVAVEVGGIALAIDAKDAHAAAWYVRFGAVPLLDDPLKLMLPLATIADAIRAAETRRR